MLVNSILYYCQHLCEHNTHLDCWMELWIQTVKPDVEQLEQDMESKSMIILCGLIVVKILRSFCAAWMSTISQLTPVKLTYPTFPHYLNIIFLSTSLSTKWSFSSGVLNATFIFHLYHACYMLYPSCSPSFDFSNNIWQVLQISKLSTVQLCQSTCDFLPCMSKYSSHHAVLKHMRPCAITSLW